MRSLSASLTRVGMVADSASSLHPSAVLACIEGGINWIDATEAEMDALADGPLVVARRHLTVLVGFGAAAAARDGTRVDARPAVHRWRRRLPRGVSIVPVLDRDAADLPGAWEGMQRLVADGVVPAAALANPSLESLHRASRAGQVALVRVTLSLGHRAAAAEVLPECAGSGIDVLARSEVPASVGARLGAALGAVELRHGNLRSTAAIAWTLSWPGVAAAAAPVRSADDASALLDAAQLKLNRADLDDIAHALSEDDAGSGPVRPGVHA